jgi:hypothetical protein
MTSENEENAPRFPEGGTVLVWHPPSRQLPPSGLTAQHRYLVTQHQNLQVLATSLRASRVSQPTIRQKIR